jgi:hypothetical protein
MLRIGLGLLCARALDNTHSLASNRVNAVKETWPRRQELLAGRKSHCYFFYSSSGHNGSPQFTLEQLARRAFRNVFNEFD